MSTKSLVPLAKEDSLARVPNGFVERFVDADLGDSFALPVNEEIISLCEGRKYPRDPELHFDGSFLPEKINEDAADYTELVPKKSHEEVLRELLSQSEID